VDRTKVYEPAAALALIQGLPQPKFDATVEVAVRLGIDPKKSDQLVRGAVSLPKGLGKKVTVIVFAEGDKAAAAKEAGADEVGSAELAERIQGGWTDFDIVITSPDMMKHVGKLGKVLGPQGKMPSPKSGTVTPDVAAAVREFKAGKVEFRTDAGGNVHALLGKRSFPVEDLRLNLQAFLDHVSALRPSAAKGAFFRKISISTTMGPGVLIAWEVVHA
jgi:large subunit ribosomal protein L1